MWLHVIVFTLAALSTFVAYGASRGGLSEQFGFEPYSVVFHALVSLVLPGWMCIPASPVLLVVVGFIALYARDGRRPECRFPQHPTGTRCCSGCGYPAAGLASERCPECGAGMFVVTRRPGLAGGRRLLLLLAIGWVSGWITSETYISIDEVMFRREALASGFPQYSRARWWPNTDAGLVYNGGNFTATD